MGSSSRGAATQRPLTRLRTRPSRGHFLLRIPRPRPRLTQEMEAAEEGPAVVASLLPEEVEAEPSPDTWGDRPGGVGVSDLTILHFNDVYEVDPRPEEPVGGAAR